MGAGRDNPNRDELETILKVAKATARACGANNDEADETAQSTVVRLWTKWDDHHIRRARQRGATRWIGYIRQVARNVHLDRIRAHQRRRSREMKASDLRPPTSSSSMAMPVSPCPLDALLARAAIAEEIIRLPKEQRIVAALYFLESMTVPEIAEERGIQPQTVRKHLRAARETIRLRFTEAETLTR